VGIRGGVRGYGRSNPVPCCTGLESLGGGEHERGNHTRSAYSCMAHSPVRGAWYASDCTVPFAGELTVSGAVLFVSLERGHPVYGAASKLSRFGSSRRS
jgi:hypothetical protein